MTTETPAPSSSPEAPIVNCPNCKALCRFSPENPYRPFCSARCKGLDFGAWASEHFRMPTNAGPDESEPSRD